MSISNQIMLVQYTIWKENLICVLNFYNISQNSRNTFKIYNFSSGENWVENKSFLQILDWESRDLLKYCLDLLDIYQLNTERFLHSTSGIIFLTYLPKIGTYLVYENIVVYVKSWIVFEVQTHLNFTLSFRLVQGHISPN